MSTEPDIYQISRTVLGLKLEMWLRLCNWPRMALKQMFEGSPLKPGTWSLMFKTTCPAKQVLNKIFY